MSARYLKTIPSSIFFNGSDESEWKQGPWVKRKNKEDREFKLIELGKEEKVYVVTIRTEDTERYVQVYHSEPNDKIIKDEFFKNSGMNYDKRDWGNCISYDIKECDIK